jgi:hypothetical protein
MREIGRWALCSAAVLVAMASTAPAAPAHDLHSPNMSLLANFNDDGSYREGSDLAFWGRIAIAGVSGSILTPAKVGGFRVMDISVPAAPRQLGKFDCIGPQSDVSIWETLVFVSVDSPRTGPECGAGQASPLEIQQGTAWEGIRVVSIADPANPVQLKFVRTSCGSHTNTLIPDLANGRVLVYASSFSSQLINPDQSPTCDPTKQHLMPVVGVPLSDPGSARVVAEPSTFQDAWPGCHDVDVLVSRRMAAASCFVNTQLWDIADPLHPRQLAVIFNPYVLHSTSHSAAFSYDGKTLVVGHELGLGFGAPGCLSGDAAGHLPLGALGFYDISDPKKPVLRSLFSLPQREASIPCTAHNFNVVPTLNGRKVLVAGWQNGGTTVLDFTDPSDVKQLGWYIAKDPMHSAVWSAYWYNGAIYANNFDEPNDRSRGLDVFAIDDPALEKVARLRYLNPQTQEAVPEPPPATAAKRPTRSRAVRLCSQRMKRTSNSKRLACRQARQRRSHLRQVAT